MRGVDAVVAAHGELGRWTVVVSSVVDGAPASADISMFRGFPITVEALSWTDPFGPETATLTVPGVSATERIPGSDTWWLAAGTRVAITYEPTNQDTVEALAALRPELADGIAWEGVVTSKSFSIGSQGVGVTLECIGAMRVLDSRVAPAIRFSRPHTYEWVIGRHITHANANHPTGLAPMRTVWPSWWTRRYEPDSTLPDYLQPDQVTAGYPWTGMTTREFGRWDAVLSSTIQGLLSVMFTERGQFTLMLDPGAVPVLRHRDHLLADDETTLHIDAAWPGIEIALTMDESQTVNAVYGEARSTISGASYKGLRYNLDGSSSGYDPFEVHGSVDPMSVMRDTSVIRRELYINFSDGLAPADAIEKARIHIGRNASPGITGTITITGASPLVKHPDGRMVPYPSVAIRAGDSIRVHGLLGSSEGVLFGISKATSAPMADSVTLTVDTKFRDYMTVREVMDRGRDALRPWHMMTVGKYNVNIPDAVMRWNYAEGSGYIPYESFTGGLWDGAPNELRFPWTEWTRKRPPRSESWRRCYLKVPAIVFKDGNRNADARQNWNRPESIEHQNGCFVLLSQAGEIALLQVAAYDAEGNVKKVPFHLSIWGSNGASAMSSPLLHADTTCWYTDADGFTKQVNYADGMPYPFFPDAWEQYLTDGRQGDWVTDAQPSEDGLFIGYGNYWEKAGYWPGTGRTEVTDTLYPEIDGVRSMPTGLLVDEAGWSYDMSQFAGFSLNSPDSNILSEHGNATVLVYCESDTDTYFLGRLFRKEYGS